MSAKSEPAVSSRRNRIHPLETLMNHGDAFGPKLDSEKTSSLFINEVLDDDKDHEQWDNSYQSPGSNSSDALFKFNNVRNGKIKRKSDVIVSNSKLTDYGDECMVIEPETLFFRDGQRKIDMVLAYDYEDPENNAEADLKTRKRSVFQVGVDLSILQVDDLSWF